MFNLDEEKIECALGNKEFCFWQGKKVENVLFFISYVGSRGIYLSLTHGAKYELIMLTNIEILG